MAVRPIALATRTHIGLVRQTNQDSLAVDADLGLAVLADGMGGHRGGEVASRVAVEAVLEALVPAQREDRADHLESLLRVGEAAEFANRAVREAAAGQAKLQGMGTTLVVAMFRGDRIFYAHVGDSRLYRVRYGRLRRLTRDHSLIQRMIDEGLFLNRAAARAAGVRENVLTRGLGLQAQAEVDVGDALVEAGDTYLLCSDGLHCGVPDSAIARLLRDPHGDLEAQAQALVDAALAAGGQDNVSVVLARPGSG